MSDKADQQIRDLERRYFLEPGNVDLARQLGAWYERTGWTYEGRTIEQWTEPFFSKNYRLQRKACGVLKVLGPRAFGAIPLLIKALRVEKYGSHHSTRGQIINTLGMLGPSAVAESLAALDYGMNSSEVLSVLARVGGTAKQYLPVLLERLREQELIGDSQEFYEHLILLSDSSNIAGLLDYFREAVCAKFWLPSGFLESLHLLGEAGRPLLGTLLKLYEKPGLGLNRPLFFTAFAAIAEQETKEIIFDGLESSGEAIHRSALIAVAHIDEVYITHRVKQRLRELESYEHSRTHLKCHLLLSKWGDVDLLPSLLNTVAMRESSRKGSLSEDLRRSYPRLPHEVLLYYFMAISHNDKKALEYLENIPPRSLFHGIDKALEDKDAAAVKPVVRYLLKSDYPASLCQPALEKAALHENAGIREIAKSGLAGAL